MSFPKYPKYKDSGVEWLGGVPEHWETSRLKNHLARNDGGVWGDDPVGSGGTIVLRSTEQTVDGRWQIEEPALRTLSESDVSAALLTEGDLLLTKSSGSSLHIGKTCLVDANVASMKCCYSNFMQRLRTKSSFTPKLAWYVLNNDLARLQFDLLSNSTTGLANLNATVIGQIALPIPPLSEQALIATFLDRETAKIDALIAEQQRLIELLQEKRQAVISHAVTKGLNPDARMKDSGIEWLGEVPEHWGVMAVRRLLWRVEQGWSPECFAHPAENEEWGIVKAGCVNRGVFNENDNKALPDSLAPLPEYEIQAGDLLMSRASGSPELVGSTAYVEQVRPRLMLSDKIFRLHPTSIMTHRYFALLFNAPLMRRQIERAISGAEGLANNLPQSALKSFFCVVPPVEEQHAIESYVSFRLTEFSLLSGEAHHAITLLQERRSALISAAVTGQIDVRGLAGAEAA